MPRKLTKKKADVPERWELFCEEFLIDFNATKAARRSGYSPKGATVRGVELMRSECVQFRLAQLIQARKKRVELSQQQVVNELQEQLSVTLPDICEWDESGVRIKDAKSLSDVEKKSLKKMKVRKIVRERHDKSGAVVQTTTSYQYEVELHDRMHVVEMAGRHLGMWKDTHVHIHDTADFQGIPDEKLDERLKEIRAERITTTKE